MQRFMDYAVVLGVVAVLMALFRLSRYLLARMLRARAAASGEPDCDETIRIAFRFLLIGLLFLPLVTALAARLDSRFLSGGVYLHLSLVAVSIVLFSFAEDLFAGMKRRPRTRVMKAADHFRTAGPSLLIFWVLGSLFLSPIFYTALTVVLGGFYLFALAARPERSAG